MNKLRSPPLSVKNSYVEFWMRFLIDDASVKPYPWFISSVPCPLDSVRSERTASTARALLGTTMNWQS